MSSTWNNNIGFTVFGESHGPAIGVVNETSGLIVLSILHNLFLCFLYFLVNHNISQVLYYSCNK